MYFARHFTLTCATVNLLEGETGLKYRCAELCAVNDANLGGTWQKNVLNLDITDVMQKAFSLYMCVFICQCAVHTCVLYV